MADRQFDEYVKGLTDTVAELNKDLTRLEADIAKKDKEIERLEEAYKKIITVCKEYRPIVPKMIDKIIVVLEEVLNQSDEAPKGDVG